MNSFAIVLTLLSAPLSALAEGSISISVKLSPAGSFVAKSDKLKGELVKQGELISSEKISVTIETFKTGMNLRDEHFCKHLGCQTNPKAVLTNLKGTKGKGNGTLELNGVKKDISFIYETTSDNVTAKMGLNAADFKMPHAKYLGIEVSDMVQVEVTAPLSVK